MFFSYALNFASTVNTQRTVPSSLLAFRYQASSRVFLFHVIQATATEALEISKPVVLNLPML